MSHISNEEKIEIEALKDFNDVYRTIVQFFQKMCTKKSYSKLTKARRLQLDYTFDRYLRLVNNAPTFAIINFGPLIFSNRERIANGDDEHFVNKNYTLFIKNMSNKFQFDFEYGMMMLDMTKLLYPSLSHNEKTWVIEQTQFMLTLYSQYEISKQKQEN
jgi:hypothetical protein